MSTHLRTFLIGHVLLATSACYAGAPDGDRGEAQRLLPPADGDLVAPPPIPDAPPPPPSIDRAPVALSWPIDQAADDLAARPPPHRADSRAWWQIAAPAQLAAGLPLPISEPGALLRLSPQDGAPLTAEQLELVAPDGAVLPGNDALRPLPDPTHLAETGAAFSPGTSLFTLRPDLGAGEFTLRAVTSAPALVYVLERASTTRLSLAPASELAFAGDRVRVAADLRDGDAVLSASSIEAALIAPDGARTGFTLAPAPDGGYAGELDVPAHHGPPGALYTLQVDAVGANARGLRVRRSVTNALAVSLPTARLAGPVATERDDAGLRFILAVDVGAASRFGASAVLYGTNDRGQPQPIAVGQAARWLESGPGDLALEFDAAALSAAGMRAPYELRDLRFVDQGRVQVLHRQARALAVTDPTL
jgi:hypothetical protein